MLQRQLSSHVAFPREHVSLHNVRQIVNHDLSQPGDEFTFRVTTKLRKIAVRLADGFLHDIRGADSVTQFLIQLRRGKNLEVLQVELQQPTDGIHLSIASLLDQLGRTDGTIGDHDGTHAGDRKPQLHGVLGPV